MKRSESRVRYFFRTGFILLATLIVLGGYRAPAPSKKIKSLMGKHWRPL
jgi:hypothetical protein